jgi:hypothetical protein
MLIWREYFYLLDEFTALRFKATGALLAARGMRTLPMNQHGLMTITFGMN